MVSQTIPSPVARKTKKGLPPILIIGALFFIFGFVTWLNSVLIPYLKMACRLNNLESLLVAFAFYISYFVTAIPSAKILKYTGFKKGMALGLFIMAVGALIFIPAATTRVYSLFLLGLFIQGTGLAILQTAANPYITVLGPPESAATRMSIMGICNKVAGAIAPLVLGAVTLKGADELKAKLLIMSFAQQEAALNELSSRVILPYICMIVVLVLLAVLIYFAALPEIDTEHEDEELALANSNKTSVLQFPHLLLGVLAMFLYVGVEVMAGDTIINYGVSQGIALATAKFFSTITLSCMIIGYVAGIVCVPRYITQDSALKVSALLGVLLAFGAVFTQGYTSVLFIALMGLANSLMWPALWPLALAGLGRFTKIGSSLLIMGIAGGAILPLAYGALADKFDTRHAYIIMVPAYLFIWYYAVKGHNVKSKKA
ncbi:glucose/galactose MFS transporter [Mucilaginibacter sp. PPCGB 2223]|uniref:sugar MFS transporter n=1 Tax=Mucilaginibacter sp. PPCGB 2223 TaxID=1886027 RepID=UPI000826D3DE|nr:sugar MFS transporter [Mucilaginibacter sp. PPCGB 2223]OCX51565.1 glucose/galactose MFS transporter [Mucilaginibacter sp. PPCGB 2223]